MEFITAIAIILVTLLTIVYGYFKYSFAYFKLRNIPHNEPIIPYGNLKGFGKTINQCTFLKNLYDQYKPTGAKLCGAFYFTNPAIVLMDLGLIKHILVKDFTNFDERGFYYNEEDDPLSAHLLSLEGDKWKQLRTKLTPTFTSGKMKYMFETVVQVADRFRDCLFDSIKENDELELKDLLARFTTDVIGTCAFGIECNSLKDPDAEFRRYGREMMQNPRHSPTISVLLNGIRNIGRRLHIKWFRDEISAFFTKIVHDTVEYREQNKVQRNDFMDILINLKNQKTDDKSKTITMNEISAQVLLFFIAGFETTATILTFCLYELALNPEIQAKTRRLIKETLDKHNGKCTYEMIMDLPYVDQVLNETFRKYPPLPTLDRVAKKQYKVPGTDYIFEKGSSLIIPVYAIHHDPEYYPDPEKFDPDRFSSEAIKQRDSMTWLPFGDGPRNCIGLRFGMMEARIGLVTLLSNFELSFGPKSTVPLVIDPKMFVLSSVGGVYLKFKPIE